MHAAMNLLRKQHAKKSLQDYIAYWTDMCHQSMKHNPTTIDNKLVIILFIKNLYNKDIRKRVAGTTNVNTLLDTFKTVQWNLLKLKKYEGLVSEDDSIHSVQMSIKFATYLNLVGTSPNQGMSTRLCLQFRMDSPI